MTPRDFYTNMHYENYPSEDFFVAREKPYTKADKAPLSKNYWLPLAVALLVIAVGFS